MTTAKHTDHPPVEQAPTPDKGVQTVAVIDIGATAIRMEIAEVKPDGLFRPLENLHSPVHLGKDTFTRGRIQQSTIHECVDILKKYRRVMQEYGISRPDQVLAVATSSVREADNRDTFLDRVYTTTQINVRAIDEAEESQLAYLAVQNLLDNEPDLKGRDVLVIEVGGGSTELLLVQNGHVTFSNSYRMGSLRMRETLEMYRTPPEKARVIIGQHIQRIVEQIARNVPQSHQPVMIAMSGDARFAASQICADWAEATVGRMDRKTFVDFTEKIMASPMDRLVKKRKLSFQEAETVGPALLAYVYLLRAFNVEQILVPKTSLRDGLLRDMTLRGHWTPAFAEQVEYSALTLGEKYHFDRRHAGQVAELSVKLFRELQLDHQLSPRFEILLKIAALLHEIGAFVSTRSHHKHSMYLILNSDLFGLTHQDTTLIALTARYHRRAQPGPSHPEYMTLTRDDRIAVSKMAAILRIADALDRTHLQQLRDLVFTREKDRFIITVKNVEDLTMERMAVKEKGNFFEESYGMSVVLQEDRREGAT